MNLSRHTTHVPVMGVMLALGFAPAALGQTAAVLPSHGIQSTANVVAALSYPNSAQRFFEAGLAQFEAEIKQLMEADEQAQPLLTLQSEALKQFEEQ